MPYAVLASVPVKPQHMAEACSAVAAIVAQTLDESGCLEFRPYRAADGSATIHIFEEWSDRAAFDFHHAQEYTKDVYAKYENWLAGEPVLVNVEPLKD